MAITAIRLQNFMAFGDNPDAEWIELKPITLLFGRNSSGKSAIIRALRLLKQSLTDAPAGSPFAFKVEDGVDLGSFQEMIHGQHDLSKEVSFGFRFTVAPSWLKNFQGNDDLPPDENWVELTLGFRWQEDQEQVVLVLLLCEAPRSAIDEEDRRCIFRAERLHFDLPDDTPENWYFESDFFVQHELPDKDNIWRVVTINLKNGFLPQLKVTEVAPDEENWGTDFDTASKLLEYFSSTAKQFFAKIEYIRPIRPEPKRFFTLDEVQQLRWVQLGLNSYLMLICEKLSAKEYAEFDLWLKELEIGVSLRPKNQSKIPNIVRLTELVLDEGGDGIHEVNLVDVGFGASQVIPVVIQSVLAKEGSLVIIEQPELHLHPRAQAVLADLFIKRSRHGVRFLIETHSEHILLRLQRRIAETTYETLQANKQKKTEKNKARNDSYNLVSKEFILIFIFRIGMESNIEKVKTDNLGQLLNPSSSFQDFFKDDYDEVVSRNQTIGDIMRLEIDYEHSD